MFGQTVKIVEVIIAGNIQKSIFLFICFCTALQIKHQTNVIIILGSSCLKAITLTIQDTVLYLQRDLQMTTTTAPGYSSMTAKYKVIKTTFFDIIHAEIGVTLLWDRGTRILVALSPKYRGKVQFINDACSDHVYYLMLLLSYG